MRITFSQSGGFGHFPGLARTVDTSTLGHAEASRLIELVDGAKLFEKPSHVGAPRAGAADYRTFEITVEDGTRAHTIRVSEPIDDPTLRALVDFLRAQVRSAAPDRGGEGGSGG